MRTVHLSGKVAVTEQAEPVPGAGEALVRVLLAGICGTDLELARGYMDFEGVPGHEFVGIVEEAAGNTEERSRWLGQRVVAEININCGSCPSCASGLGRHCPTRTVLGIAGKAGAHAEWVTVPLRLLHAVPDRVPEQDAVFIEPLAAACEVLEQVEVGSADRCLVVGDGRLGQLVARVLATACDSVGVLGRHPAKLAHLEPLGIQTSTDVTKLEPGYDLIVDASGSPSGAYAAARLVRPRGTLVLKSTYQGERPLPIAKLVVDEITIVGSRCGPFDVAIPLLASGRVQVADLVTETHPLAEASRAYERAAARDSLKILLKP